MATPRLPAVRAPREMAEKIRRRLLEMGVLDTSRSIGYEDGVVLLPIKSADIMLSDGCTVVDAILPNSRRQVMAGRVGVSFDLVGSIAVINKPIEIDEAARLASIIMMRHPRVRTVLLKSGPVSGEERVGRYEVVAGLPVTETIHRESGCLFMLDLSKVFFNPRLSSERLRIASMVGAGEVVVDMFAGVGPFSIITAKRSKGVRVYSVEKSGPAFRYLLENIRLNRVADRVTAVFGDAANILHGLDIMADRVIMNLPHRSADYLPAAAEIVKEGGVIHLYTVDGRDYPHRSLEKALEILQRAGRRVSGAVARRVKETSPRESIFSLDLRL